VDQIHQPGLSAAGLEHLVGVSHARASRRHNGRNTITPWQTA
jgi:hypothetical protein